MRSYEYRHQVGLEDTNLVGNVYYANHVRWQGRCREMFLHQHAPEVLAELGRGLSLVTTRVSCTYYEELLAFDEVLVRMRAGAVSTGRLTMLFDYVRLRPDGHEELVARGEQEIACLRREGSRQVASALPEALRAALQPYLVPLAS
jgi:enediyne biosynthesis thioesterase